MRQMTRLLRYLIPYLFQLIAGSVLLAAVGLLFTFRLVLLRPIFDRVLNPSSGSGDMQLLAIPGTHHVIYLQTFVPARIHSVWSIIAYALVFSSLLKGICDYAGTYLVNHAGYGMITSLRNDLYEFIL
ncbi:MAG TPA: ABC transporter ATP-binding protein, partial [Terriglobales bacterium]|nr:ABC transporter ATP-binding protein [Terriglobales bacterium]